MLDIGKIRAKSGLDRQGIAFIVGMGVSSFM